MIVFLSSKEAISWVNKYHPTYINNTTECINNKILREYDSIDSFCVHIHEWTHHEKKHLQQAIYNIQHKCWTWKMLMTNHKWTLISVDNHIDGGMPHTIYKAIVIPQWLREALCQDEQSTTYQNAIETMIHEQIHCLQKQYPQLFEKLYNDWGYTKLSEHKHYHHIVRDIHQQFPRRTNPDTPLEWILYKKWYQVVLFNDSPKSLTDVSYVLIDLQEYATDRLPQQQQNAIMHQTDAEWFTDIFGHSAHCYHPDETSAVLLSQLIFDDYQNGSKLQHTSRAVHTLVSWIHQWCSN